MKRRVVKKVEKMMLVDKLCELQQQICEYDRFLGDLVVMLSKKESQCVLIHNVDKADWIWDRVKDLIAENKRLAQDLQEKQA